MAEHLLVEFDSVQTLYFLLEKAVKFPNKQHCVIEEIILILRTTKFDTKGLTTTLEFYKCLYPTVVAPLERNLFACGVLSEEDITKSALPSFLAKVLFEVVTKSATDCAEYCANVWLERYAISRHQSNFVQYLALPTLYVCNVDLNKYIPNLPPFFLNVAFYLGSVNNSKNVLGRISEGYQSTDSCIFQSVPQNI